MWLAYNNPNWIVQRHGLGADVALTVEVLSIAQRSARGSRDEIKQSARLHLLAASRSQR